MRKACVAVLFLAIGVGACGKKKEEEKTKAVEDGTYVVGGPAPGETIPVRTVCAGDGKRPELSAGVSSDAALLQLTKFGDIVVNNVAVTVAGEAITRVWSRDADLGKAYPPPNANLSFNTPTCSITWSGTIVVNEDQTFQESGSYTVTWKPADCQMEVHNFATSGAETGVGRWAQAATWPGAFVSATGAANRDPWTVSKDGGVLTLTMPDDVAARQTAYACAGGSRVVKNVWTAQ